MHVALLPRLKCDNEDPERSAADKTQLKRFFNQMAEPFRTIYSTDRQTLPKDKRSEISLETEEANPAPAESRRTGKTSNVPESSAVESLR